MLFPVLAGVTVLGVVAAPHLTTLEASSQVDPGVTHFYTLFAHLRSRLNYISEPFEVFARFRAHSRPSADFWGGYPG